MSASEAAIVFFLFSFLGWCMEVLLVFIREHILVNRGFLIGPYCPIYGIGVVFIIVMIKDVLTLPYGIFPVFLCGMIICGILEYFVSWFLEKRYHARWWDYSTKPCNINGRVWIGNLILFGIASVIITMVIYPFLITKIRMIPDHIRWIISIVIIVIMSTDTLLTRFAMAAIREQIEGCSLDDTEEISYYIHEYLHQMPYTIRHLDHAFPSFDISSSFIMQKIRQTKLAAQKSLEEADNRIETKRAEFAKDMNRRKESLKDVFLKEEQKSDLKDSVYNNTIVKKEEDKNE